MANPYVYCLVHKHTGCFYIGFRAANKVEAELDLGSRYFSSSKIVSENFEDYNYFILSKHRSKDEAYDQEQLLIYLCWGDKLLLNKRCHFGRNRFRVEKGHLKGIPKTPEHRQKIAQSNLGRKRSHQTRLNISLRHRSMCGSANSFFGRRHSERAKSLIGEKNRKALTGKRKPASFSQKISNVQKHRVLCNDGSRVFRLLPNDPKINSLNRGGIAGRKYYNDGVKNYRLFPNDPRTKILRTGKA